MTTKTFDAVRMMRDLRDHLSQAMEHMAPEERVRYIRDKAASTHWERKVAVNTRKSPGALKGG